MELSVNITPKWSPVVLGSPQHKSAENSFVPILYLRASTPNSELTLNWIFEACLLPESILRRCEARKLVMQRAGKSHTKQRVHFYISQTVLDQYAERHGLPKLPASSGRRSYHCPVITELARLAMPYVESPSLFSLAFLDDLQFLLCGQLVHAHRAGLPEPVVGRGGLSTWQRRTANEYLKKKRFANITLSELAEECQLSSSHFARSFKITFGQPVHAWVLRQRVSSAKRLMLETDEQLVEVAFQAGFPDQTTFNRTFLKIEGISPGRWKRIHKP